MSKEVLKDYTYAELLVTPGYEVDFAVGTTYSMNPKALLIIPIALGMFSELNENTKTSKIFILESIRRSSEKFALFCNRGSIHLPNEVLPFFPLLENCVFDVYNKRAPLSNFHPKIWILKERNIDNPNDEQIKILVMSRNLTLDNNLDMILTLTGKIDTENSKNSKKHRPLKDFLYDLSKYANPDKRNKIKNLADELSRVKRFSIDEDNFKKESYEFIPILFGKNYNKCIDVQSKENNALQGDQMMIISPFIDKETVTRLNSRVDAKESILVTTSGYVTKDIYDLYDQFNRTLYVPREQLNDNSIAPISLHAKTYLVCNPKNQYGIFLYLGSANATDPAFHINSEFLIRLQFKYYKQNVFNNFKNEFLRIERENGNSLFYEPATKPEIDEVHENSDIESFLRRYIAQEFKATCSKNEDETFDVTITTNNQNSQYDLEIAPLQSPNYKTIISDNCVIREIPLMNLSEFYIIYCSNGENTESKIIKIPTSGLPSKFRDIAIYKSIINSREKFLNYISFMLSDDPESYLFELREFEKLLLSGQNSDKPIQIPVRIYEQMLELMHKDPKRIFALEDIVQKLGNEQYAQDFINLLNVFKSVKK